MNLELINNFLYGMNLLIKYGKKYCLYLILSSILLSIDNIYTIVIIKIIIHSLSYRDITKFIKVTFFLFFVSWGLSVVNILLEKIFLKTERIKLQQEFNVRIISIINKISYQKYDDLDTYNQIYFSMIHGSSSILSLAKNLSDFFGTILSIIGISNIVLTYDNSIFVILVFYVVINIFVHFISAKIEYLENMEYVNVDRNNSYIQRVFYLKQYIKDLKVYRWIELFIKRYRLNYANKIKIAFRYGKKQLMMENVNVFSQMVLQIIVLILLAFDYIQSKILLEDFFVSYNGALELSDKLLDFFGFFPLIYEDTFMIENLRRIANQENNYVTKFNHLEIDSLKIEDLTFGYCNQRVLDKFNYTFKKGNSYALIGKNGSGKSTLLNIICGLISTKGNILINNELCNDSTELYGLVSPVFQDFQFHSFTLGENLLLRKLNDYDFDRIYRALEIVGLKEKVLKLENGLNTYVTHELADNGCDFSGGELQRLAIARMLLNMKEIVIMDESDSALDKKSRENILARIKPLMKDKIFIYVTHDKDLLEVFDYVIDMG